MEPLIASAITTALTLYVLRDQNSQTQIGLSVAVGLGTYYSMSQTEENKSTRHVDIDPTTNCSYQDVQHSGEIYACVM
jgi:hypothetical protein